MLFATLAPAAFAAGGRSVEITAAWSVTSAVKTFPDPVYVGEYDYVSSTAQQAGASARLENFFWMPFTVAYQGLSVGSAARSAQGNFHRMTGYFSSVLNLSSSVDTGIFRWHFGFAAMYTQTRRSHYDDATASVVSEPAIDTALSQVYPTGGFTLFPQAPIRISMIFLRPDAHLLYGWLRVQAEFEIGRHTFAPALELLNHASFGKGLPNFAEPPGAFTLGYTINLTPMRLHTRVGFVLNSTQGFNGERVAVADRLIFELGAAYIIAP